MNTTRKRFIRKLTQLLQKVSQNRDDFEINIEKNVSQQKLTLKNEDKELVFIKRTNQTKLSGSVYANWFLIPGEGLSLPLDGVVHVTEEVNIPVTRLLEEILNGENSFEKANELVEGFLD